MLFRRLHWLIYLVILGTLVSCSSFKRCSKCNYSQFGAEYPTAISRKLASDGEGDRGYTGSVIAVRDRFATANIPDLSDLPLDRQLKCLTRAFSGANYDTPAFFEMEGGKVYNRGGPVWLAKYSAGKGGLQSSRSFSTINALTTIRMRGNGDIVAEHAVSSPALAFSHKYHNLPQAVADPEYMAISYSTCDATLPSD